SAIGDIDGLLAEYMAEIAVVDPNALDADDALAHWINVYNAGALGLAARADREGSDSVLRIPGAFSSPIVTVADEPLSLDGIEHGKIRRFGDPRIHGALVCGSVSCPTLRAEPFVGAALDAQLDDQLRAFLSGGGAVLDDDHLTLSRVFQWYGSDFVRPHRMPTVVPAPRRATAAAITPWLPESTAERVATGVVTVGFAPYDWGLRCSVA
ncbi:MAG: DUF547 domain-containing protein, partial [Acidimicrobiia bacterium]|nr:DUF547 domain-containing protein [Acidimicrobiia bacterium]